MVLVRVEGGVESLTTVRSSDTDSPRTTDSGSYFSSVRSTCRKSSSAFTCTSAFPRPTTPSSRDCAFCAM